MLTKFRGVSRPPPSTIVIIWSIYWPPPPSNLWSCERKEDQDVGALAWTSSTHTAHKPLALASNSHMTKKYILQKTKIQLMESRNTVAKETKCNHNGMLAWTSPTHTQYINLRCEHLRWPATAIWRRNTFAKKYSRWIQEVQLQKYKIQNNEIKKYLHCTSSTHTTHKPLLWALVLATGAEITWLQIPDAYTWHFIIPKYLQKQSSLGRCLLIKHFWLKFVQVQYTRSSPGQNGGA